MPRSSREKSVETRSNIIEAAYRLFIERGYSATAVRDIGRQAGITVGAIYNHFQTKEEIWVEVLLIKHPYHEILPLIRSAEGETVAEVVRSTARLLVQELLKRPDLFNLMFIEVVEFKAAHVPALVETILPDLSGLKNVFQGKRGCVRDIPDIIVLRSFFGLFFSYYITGIFMKNISGVIVDETSLDQFVDLYLYGLLEETTAANVGGA